MRSVLTALCLFATTAHAVPAQFTHQGRLLDADALPMDGEATITFRVTDSESGGTALWEDEITVLLTNGFYSAVLGASADNPLDTEVLAQAPVWLELQLEGEGAMYPRSPINSVPYATMATVAEEVSGGPVDASEIAVAGSPVINDAGEWVGPAPTVNWTDIEGMPEGFSDGIDDDTDTDTDTDSFADLAVSCVDGDIPVWDGVVGEWVCDFDQDTLADIDCLDGQLIRWSADSTGWVCADDVDTVLSEEEVDDMVADNGYAMASEVFSGSFLDLVDVAPGLADGDDDTQLTAEEVDAIVADNGYAMATDVFSGSFLDLADVPDGLEDGDSTLSAAEVSTMVADDIATYIDGIETLNNLDCATHAIAVQTDIGWQCSTLQEQLDKDGDGIMVWADCDDTDATIAAKTADVDCDGVPTSDDCDDTDPDVVDSPTEDDPDCDGLIYDIIHTGATSSGGDGYRWDESSPLDSRRPVSSVGECADFCKSNSRCAGFMWKFEDAHSDSHPAFGYLACSLYETLTTSPTGVEHIWSGRME